MSTECPVCREPIPWRRTFFSTAWSRWRCDACDSLLRINVGRRFLAGVLWVVLYYLVTRVIRVPLNWDFAATMLSFAVVLWIHFLYFECATVVERCGFRCGKCGYDLQGQVEPRCPECGRELGSTETARLQRVHSGMDTGSASGGRRRTGWIAIGMMALLFSATVAAVIGTHMFRAGTAKPSSTVRTGQMLQALQDFSGSHGGSGPVHAIELVLGGDLRAADFTTADSMSAARAISVGEVSLVKFDVLAPERQRSIVSSVREALLRGTIAHRLGDFVFTHQGIDLSASDPRLWVVIWSPDPDQNAALQTLDTIPVGVASGEVIQVKTVSFLEALSEQNTIRVEHGLAPLDNPFAVTHSEPMVQKP